MMDMFLKAAWCQFAGMMADRASIDGPNGDMLSPPAVMQNAMTSMVSHGNTPAVFYARAWFQVFRSILSTKLL